MTMTTAMTTMIADTWMKAVSIMCVYHWSTTFRLHSYGGLMNEITNKITQELSQVRIRRA
jgi:hypothetical protein